MSVYTSIPCRSIALLIPTSLLVASAYALSLSDLSHQDASGGLKAALMQGSSMAVAKLGAENGFLNNEKVRIQLPKILEQARPLLKMTGKGQQLDELVVQMNHAAEAAVPMAKPLLLDAVKSMSISDAKNILTGGDTSVTDFFREKTAPKLAVEGYVTQRTLDGLYTMIADEEKAIRADPIGSGSGSGSKLIAKVFGALK